MVSSVERKSPIKVVYYLQVITKIEIQFNRFSSFEKINWIYGIENFQEFSRNNRWFQYISDTAKKTMQIQKISKIQRTELDLRNFRNSKCFKETRDFLRFQTWNFVKLN